MRWQEIKDNPQMKNNLLKRADMLRSIRTFFDNKGFVEIDSPILIAKPNMEPNLDIFKTLLHKNTGEEMPAFLIASPEFALKKILAAGISKIYQLGKCFRNNEPWNENHNPEFTLLEWYETQSDYFKAMDRIEELVTFLFNNQQEFIYQGKVINISKPWLRISMREAWQKYANLDLNDYLSYATMRALAEEKKYSISDNDAWEDLFFKIFLTEVEPRLCLELQPIFLFDYPVSMAALAKVKKEDPCYAERFELYVAGLEVANAYSELTDAKEQRQRFKKDQKEQIKRGLSERQIDEDFLSALESGIPQCSGVALGVDRLIMLLLNAKNINEVVPFSCLDMFES